MERGRERRELEREREEERVREGRDEREWGRGENQGTEGRRKIATVYEVTRCCCVCHYSSCHRLIDN